MGVEELDAFRWIYQCLLLSMGVVSLCGVMVSWRRLKRWNIPGENMSSVDWRFYKMWYMILIPSCFRLLALSWRRLLGKGVIFKFLTDHKIEDKFDF